MMVKEQRLIDANAMREEWLEQGENEYVYDTNAVLDSIDAQPTVEAVEVVHARWVKVFDDSAGWVDMCNRCKEFGDGKLYCSMCGAKMDGGTENDLFRSSM